MRRQWRRRAFWSTGVPLLAAVAVLVSGCASSSAGQPRTTPTASTAPSPTGGTTTPGATTSALDWLTYGYDAARNGVNPAETAITAQTVGKLHRLWRVKLPTIADSEAMYVHGLKLPDGSTHDVLYITTKDARLIAVDAANGDILWQKPSSSPRYTTSSPVVSPDHKYVYSYGLEGQLHRYDAATGAETTGNGWPVRITYMPNTEKVSSPLNIANGKIYVTTAGYPGDAPPYQGHIVVIDAQTGAARSFNSLCSDHSSVLREGECGQQQSGIWARGGAVVDPLNGNLYVSTGNGDFNGRTDWGDSVIQVTGDGSRVVDSYTPSNQGALNSGDVDLGSTTATLLPRIANSKTPYLLTQDGKDGVMRLINRQDMSGQGSPGHLGGELQTVKTGCGVYNQPAVWTDPTTHTLWLLVTCRNDTTGYRVVTDSSGTTRLQQGWRTSGGSYGTSPVVAGGVLFYVRSSEVVGVNPATGQQLWSSQQASAGGNIGGIHWEGLTVTNGHLYIPDEDGYLNAYSL